jgi:hypothetical protein
VARNWSAFNQCDHGFGEREMPRNRKKGRSRRVSSKPDTTPSQTKLTAKDEEEAKQTVAERAQEFMAEVARRKASLAAS